jgi:hypothetical protein
MIFKLLLLNVNFATSLRMEDTGLAGSRYSPLERFIGLNNLINNFVVVIMKFTSKLL